MGRKFLVRCKHCGCEQLMEIRDFYPVGKWKKCVYCSKYFLIHKDIYNSQIIKEITATTQ